MNFAIHTQSTDTLFDICISNDFLQADITNGPFTVAVRTNDIDVGGGFSIYYRQNPCMSTAG